MYTDKIQMLELSGLEGNTTLNFTVPSYLRQFNYRGYIFEVIQINQPYKSEVASGFIGLGPYTAINALNVETARVDIKENFLYQLKS